jgi:hypothetical protein
VEEEKAIIVEDEHDSMDDRSIPDEEVEEQVNLISRLFNPAEPINFKRTLQVPPYRSRE